MAVRFLHLSGTALVPGPAAAGPEAPLVVWIDLLSPTQNERADVEALLGIDLPTREETREIEASSRLYVDEEARFMTITALAGLSRDIPEKTPLTFILTNGTLVTIRHLPTRVFDAFGEQCEKGGTQVPHDGEQVMLGIVEAIVDATADALERISDSVDAISRHVFRANIANDDESRDLEAIIEQIGHKGDLLSLIQESLVSLRRLMAFHQATATGSRKGAREPRQRIKLIERDTASLVDHAGFLAGKISFLLDATLGLINLEQNQTIKMFSVMAVIFMPPTLIASIYGMNFALMPELHFALGYPMALVLMVVSAVLPYLYFRHKKWF